MPTQDNSSTPTIGVEPVKGHIKNEHRMGPNDLAHTQGDTINAVVAAAGYNFPYRSNG